MQAFHEAFPANSGRLQFAPAFPDYVEDVVLAADMLTRVPIPAGARFAVFSFDGDVRIKPGDATTTLALPASSSTNGTGSELNPSARRLVSALANGTAAATHLCLRARSACTGSVSFYA